VTSPIDNLPDDLESLKRLLAAEHAARLDAEAKAANAEAVAARATANVSSAEALIAHLKLAIEKMRRELYGSRSERGRKLVAKSWIRWSSSWKTSKPRPPKMSSRPR